MRPSGKEFRETGVKVWQRVKSEHLDKEEYCVLNLAKWIGRGEVPVLWREQSVILCEGVGIVDRATFCEMSSNIVVDVFSSAITEK